MVIVHYLRLLLPIIIVVIIVCVYIFMKHKYYRRSMILMLMVILLFFYCNLIGEKREILRRIRPGIIGPSTCLKAFIDKNNRFPFTVSELHDDSIACRKLNSEYTQNLISELVTGSPINIVKKPQFGLRTFISGEQIHTILYSYGFDFDDDSLKYVAFDYYEYMSQRPNEGLWYILSPISTNGDIVIEHIMDNVNNTRWPKWFIDSLLVLQVGDPGN